jgi:uncharacterized integral membrane protein
VSGPERSGGPGHDGLDEQQVRRIALVGALVLVLILALVFVVENSERVEVSFVFFSAKISLIWVITLSMAIGAGLGVLVKHLIRKRFFRDDG